MLLPPSAELSHEHPASTWVVGLVHPSGVAPVEYETMSIEVGSLPTISIVLYAAPCGVTSAYACAAGDEQYQRTAPVLTVSCRMTDHGAEQPQLPASQRVWQSAVVGSVADGSMHAALQPLRSVTSNANRMCVPAEGGGTGERAAF